MIKFRKYSITEGLYRRGGDGVFVLYTKVAIKWIPSLTIKLKAPSPWISFRWLNLAIVWMGKHKPELMNWPLIYPHSVVEDGVEDSNPSKYRCSYSFLYNFDHVTLTPTD